jgi:hypothetical protein
MSRRNRTGPSALSCGVAGLIRQRCWCGLALTLVVGLAAVGGCGTDHPAAATASPTLTPSGPTSPAPSPTPTVYITGPKLIGLTVKESEGCLAEGTNQAGSGAHLEFQVDKEYSSAPTLTVIQATVSDGSGSRVPLAGSRVPSGDTVFLVFVKKIPNVPNVLDEQVTRATRELEEKGVRG